MSVNSLELNSLGYCHEQYLYEYSCIEYHSSPLDDRGNIGAVMKRPFRTEGEG